MTVQRYVSKELTHFVGQRQLDDREGQYKTLCAILKSGRLTPHPTATRTFFGVGIHHKGKMSENRMYSASPTVCFCDIPVEDFGIHIKKYGCFGLAFLKEFLVARGASPVFYVAKNSHVAVRFKILNLRGGLSRATVFDEILPQYQQLFHDVATAFVSKENPTVVVPEKYQRQHDVKKFLDAFVLSFVQFFDDSAADDDPANLYMEREWRVLGEVEFTIRDVYRVLLPQAYAARLREDVPGYMGQVTFVPGV